MSKWTVQRDCDSWAVYKPNGDVWAWFETWHKAQARASLMATAQAWETTVTLPKHDIITRDNFCFEGTTLQAGDLGDAWLPYDDPQPAEIERLALALLRHARNTP